MIWATVTIFTPCSLENFSRSGTRAIVPSSFITSHITPAGLKPARRARSTAASVWPARCNTPPGRARSGKTWPGISRSSGPVASSTATRQVCALSAAEIPVVIPSLASILAVKAVPIREVLCLVISGISRRSIISPAIGRQMRPRPCVAMKFMSSGVTSSAAIVRSPSFSRSSSSQTITIFPALMSSMISSIWLNGIFDAPLQISWPVRPKEPLHIFRHYVCLQVDPVTHAKLLQIRVLACLGKDRDGERGVPHGDHRQANAVYADAPLLDDVAQHGLRRSKIPDLRSTLAPNVTNLPNPVHVPLHDVPAEPVRGAHRPLQVDRAPLDETSQSAAPQRLGHGVEDQRLTVELVHREAHAVHRHAVAHARVFDGPARGEPQAEHLARFERRDAPHLFNQPGEHGPPHWSGTASRRCPRLPSPRPRQRTRAPRSSSLREGHLSSALLPSRRTWARRKG